MTKKTLITLVLVVAFAVPTVGHAALQDDLQAQIQNLLRLVSSLQAQLRAIENSQTITDFSSCAAAGNAVMESYPRQCVYNGQTFIEVITQEPGTPSLVCPTLSRNLHLGVSGPDVSSLQHFLQSVGAYTYPVITGYYGTVTQQAVQQWQAQNGIVAYGSAATTGFGAVGPKTRVIIQAKCGTSLPEPTLCTLQYDPVCGRTPGLCTDTLYGGSCVDGETKTYGNSCQLKAAGAQFLYAGECRADTTPVAPNNCKIWNDGCNTCSRSYAGGPLACTKRACIWQGIPKCEVYFDDTATGVTFSALVTHGSVPLTVSFSAPGSYSCADGADYEIDYGDGTREGTSSCTLGQQTLTHTYTQAGIYTATLYSIPSGFGFGDRTPQVVGTEIITVSHY